MMRKQALKSTVVGDVGGTSTKRFGPPFSPQKVIHSISRYIHSLLACYPSEKKFRERIVFHTRLYDLPNEMLVQIMSFCDSASVMNFRQVSRRALQMVDSGRSMARKTLLTGLRIVPVPGDDSKVVLERAPSIDHRLLCKRGDLHLLFRRLRICSRVFIDGVVADDDLLNALAEANFCAVDTLVIEDLSLKDVCSLAQLISQIRPCRTMFLTAVEPLILQHAARSIVIDSTASTITLGNRLIGPFDDPFLIALVTSISLIRRAVCLPESEITHDGISGAAEAFHAQCVAISNEAFEIGAERPLLHILVLIPGTDLIDSEKVVIPSGLHEECKVWRDPLQRTRDFSVEVRVSSMNLRISVTYSSKEYAETTDADFSSGQETAMLQL